MVEYHKIETLYVRNERTHRLAEPLTLKNPVYGLLKTWHFTEKIDGTNIRVMWDGNVVTFGGRTDAAQLPADLVNWLHANVTPETFLAGMTESSGGAGVTLYGEGYGPGIQAGGGLYADEKRFILFDVVVRDHAGHDWWLSDANVRDIGQKMGLDVVPSFGEMTLEDAAAFVRDGFPSRLNGGQKLAEGLVGRPTEALFDKKGHRLIVKLKTKDFAPR